MEQHQLPTLEQRLAQIRKALSELTKFQCQLKRNASDSKNSIQSTFSRQLEALRSREVHLLTQAETLFQVKQEHFQLQVEGLQKELGALETLLDQARASGKPVALQDIENIMKRFLHIELSDNEDANLCFEGDSKELKKAILSFGFVNAKRRRLDESCSFSDQIIGAFEQFADQKTWLCKVKRSGSGSEEYRPKMAYPVFMEKGNSEAWLYKGESEYNSSMDSSDSTSDGEESFVMLPENPMKIKESFSTHFARILSSPDIQWIRPSSKTANVGVSPHQQRRGVSFYRPGGSTKDWVRRSPVQTPEKEPMDTSTPSCSPIQSPTKPIEIEDLADLACVQESPSPSPCSPKGYQQDEKPTICCSTPSSTHAFRVKTSFPFVTKKVDEVSMKMSEVFAIKTPKEVNMKTSDVFAMKTADVADVSMSDVDIDIKEICKGNETCTTFSECICDENCAISSKRVAFVFSGIPESSKNQWLVKSPCENRDLPMTVEAGGCEKREGSERSGTQSSGISSSPIPGDEIPKSDLVKEWLASKTNSTDDLSSIVSGFKKWQLEGNRTWLKTPSAPKKEEVINPWLRKTEADAKNQKIPQCEMQDEPRWVLGKSSSSGFCTVNASGDAAAWLLKKTASKNCESDMSDCTTQDEWLVKKAPTVQGLTSESNHFPCFTAPLDVNQWVKN